MTNTCSNCRFAGFWKDDGKGDCFRYPPQSSDVPIKKNLLACGEFRPIEPVKPANGGWIPWEGGGCPVDPDALVHVRLRDGTLRMWASRASEYDWRNTGRFWNIIAYRIHKEPT